MSATGKLLSGVVQGSGIGPLMLLKFINELAEIIKKNGMKVKMFAHDVKVYMKITNGFHSPLLQNAVDMSWSNGPRSDC
jgi:hypothetical protein